MLPRFGRGTTSYVAKIRPWYDELVGAASEDERDVLTREQLPRLIEAIESYKLELAGRVQAVTEGTFHALDFEGEDLPYGPLQKQIIEGTINWSNLSKAWMRRWVKGSMRPRRTYWSRSTKPWSGGISSSPKRFGRPC